MLKLNLELRLRLSQRLRQEHERIDNDKECDNNNSNNNNNNNSDENNDNENDNDIYCLPWLFHQSLKIFTLAFPSSERDVDIYMYMSDPSTVSPSPHLCLALSQYKL